jgi:hypothetical protein
MNDPSDATDTWQFRRMVPGVAAIGLVVEETDTNAKLVLVQARSRKAIGISSW